MPVQPPNAPAESPTIATPSPGGHPKSAQLDENRGPQPKEKVNAEPPELGRVAGLKAMLDDGSYLFIPYADDGLDRCSGYIVKTDGTRTPYRPPDLRNSCSKVWAEQDAVRTD